MMDEQQKPRRGRLRRAPAATDLQAQAEIDARAAAASDDTLSLEEREEIRNDAAGQPTVDVPSDRDYFEDDGMQIAGSAAADDVSAAIAAARQRQGVEREIVPERSAREIVFGRPDMATPPVPFLATAAPSDVSADSAVVQPDGAPKNGVAAEPVHEPDDVDRSLSTDRYRADVTFEWCKESGTRFHHHFSRHYFEAGVLLDVFAAATPKVQREILEKAAQIAAFNGAQLDPKQRLGYLPHLVGSTLDADDVRSARRRTVITQIAGRDVRGTAPAYPAARVEPILTNPIDAELSWR